MLKLRGTQNNFVETAVAELMSASTRKSVMVAPVAYGKSVCIANIVLRLDAGVLIIQPNRELLLQNYSKFISYGYQASICCVSLKSKQINSIEYTDIDGELVRCNHLTGITYATIGSVASRAKEIRELGIKYIIMDECHLGSSVDSTFKSFITASKIKNILGVTATALVLRGGMDGSVLRMLDKARDILFSNILHVVQVQEVVEAKYWSPLVYDIRVSELSGLRYNSSGADYTKESMTYAYDENFSERRAIAAVSDLKKEGRKSILVFVPSIEIANTLSKKIPGSEVVHSKMVPKDRVRVVNGFKRLEIQVVINVEILTTGFDHPRLDSIVLVRPTASIALYYQILGRATRIHDKKLNAKIIDLSGNVTKFGRIENLNYDYIEGYGWGLFNREVLLTNFPIQAEYRPTKASLREAVARDAEGKVPIDDMKLWFGKHSGKKLSQVPISYLSFMLDNFNFSSQKMELLKNSIKIQLKIN